MKKPVLFFLPLFVAASMFASPVSYRQAQTAAEVFFTAHGIRADNDITLSQRGPRRATANADDACFYVFNAGQDRGFVIISGDDRTAPVLGYSDTGSLDYDKAPAHVQAWLQHYADQIAALPETTPASEREEPVERLSSPVRHIQAARHAVAPLLTCLWNQLDPYNQLCPYYYDNNGQLTNNRSATGCVATAIAQVLYYYRFPDAITKAIPSLNTQNTTLPQIPRGTAINWAAMTDTYSDNSSKASQQAVAELMLYVGQAVEMGYGPESGAFFHEGAPLVTYFGYSSESHSEHRSDYTLEGWTSMIYNEVATGHPVIFSGTANNGAHAFVLDGYDADGLFHVNWGWGGMANGYFRIDVLNPGDNSGTGASASTDGYSMGQEAIILRTASEVEQRSDLITYDAEVNGTVVTVTYRNTTGERQRFWMGMGAIQDDGRITPCGHVYSNGRIQAAQATTVTLSNQTTTTASFDLSDLADGIYTIVPVSRTNNDTVWHNAFIDKRSIRAVAQDGKVTLSNSAHGTTNAHILNVENVRIPTSCIAQKEQKIEVTFRNVGDTEYYEEVSLFASQDMNMGDRKSRMPLSIKPGQTGTATFFFTPNEVGHYNLWLAYQWYGGDIFWSGEIDAVASGSSNLRITGVKYANTIGGQAYGNYIEADVSIKNNAATDFDGLIFCQMWQSPLNDQYLWTSSSSEGMHAIPAGQTVTITYRFPECANNRRYGLSFNADGVEIPGGGAWDHCINLMPGVLTYDGFGAMLPMTSSTTIRLRSGMAAADFTQATSVVGSVSGISNPNFVGALAANARIPSSLRSRNTVVGGQADTIRITSEEPFFAPVRFHAISAGFTWKPNAEGRWQTLVLPFAPDSITIGSSRQNWLGGTQPDIPIYEFDYLGDNGQPHFGSPETLTASVPYLVYVTPEIAADGIIFTAADVSFDTPATSPVVARTDELIFRGFTTKTKVNGGYVLNAEGTAFEYMEEAELTPFSAYFTTSLNESERPAAIALPDIPTGIMPITATPVKPAQDSPLYDLSGRRVRQPQHGVYIYKGHKVVINR